MPQFVGPNFVLNFALACYNNFILACCHNVLIWFVVTPVLGATAILVVNKIELETLTSNAILSTPHVAPNLCSRPNSLYDERWNQLQKALLRCRIINSINPLLWTIPPRLYFILKTRLSFI